MLFYKMFMQPYMDGDDGANLGGGGSEPTPNPTPTPEPSPTPQGGNEPTPTQTIKVKYNHQEMELPYEEAVTHIQKGMNYDKAIEREKQAARDAYVAEQYEGQTWNGKPIKTEADLKQALKEQELYQKYQEQGLPDEVVNELVESKKFREQFESEKQTKAEQERKTAEYNEFFEYFKKENGRDYNSVTDIIPQEVWDMTDKGKTLTDAYTYHYANQLKAKVAEYESKLKAQETNQNNAASSPGSVTGNGSGDTGFISFDTFEANKHDTQWVIKNFSKINESRAKW